MRLLLSILAVATIAFGVHACRREAAAVSFTSPKGGAHVSSPVMVEMRANRLTIEPSGAVHENAGHFHVIVDADCVRPGLPIETTRPGYWHFGAGQQRGELTLTPGRRRLCLQVGDGGHVALNGTDVITITVEP
jgi:uncharacterized protein DUF4399